MGFRFALIEGTALFGAVTFVSFVWLHPLLVDWLDRVAVLSRSAAISLCCAIAFYYNDLYDFRISRNFSEFMSRLLQAFGVAFILLAILYAVVPEAKLADWAFGSSLLLIVGLLLPIRAVSYAVVQSRPFTERVLVVGTSQLAQQLIKEIRSQPSCGFQILGLVGDGAMSARSCPPVLGRLEELGCVLKECRPDRIVVALEERRGRLPVRDLLEHQARGIVVDDGVRLYERLTNKLAIESMTPSNLLFSDDFRKSRVEQALARAMSLVISLVLIILLAPVALVAAIAIKLDSTGPVLFVHDRVGLNGRYFKLLKFRTMLPTADQTSEWAGDNAERITRVGKWLRKFRLDEIPQFINILRGDMNLVGPRPHPVSNFQLFTEQIPYYGMRITVRPGVTGWAQVRWGYADNLEEEIEKMRYDLYYIKHLSLWFDLRILFDTVRIVVCGGGETSRRYVTLPREAE
jgi:exopolysaccharide biosynthesis polyprenyl glycosylphosphotransferase